LGTMRLCIVTPLILHSRTPSK